MKRILIALILVFPTTCFSFDGAWLGGEISKRSYKYGSFSGGELNIINPGGFVEIISSDNQVLGPRVIDCTGTAKTNGVLIESGVSSVLLANLTIIGCINAVMSGSEFSIKNSILSDNTTDFYTANVVSTTSNFLEADGDPKFIASTNFRLKPSSPAINAGTNICTGENTPLTGCTGSGTGTWQDYDGRYLVGAPDIGAYEYQPSMQASFWQRRPTVITGSTFYWSDGTGFVWSDDTGFTWGDN